MFADCPHCRIQVFADRSRDCPQCGAALVLPKNPAPVILPHEDGLPEPHLGWAIFAVLVSYAVGAVAATGLCVTVSLFYPPIRSDREILSVLSGFAGSVVMGLLAWICLQPYPRSRLALVTPSPVQLLIALALTLPAQILGDGFTEWLGGILPINSSAVSRIGSSVYDHWFAYRALAHQPWLVVFFVGCVMPALTEEAFFRGFLGRGLLARYGVLPGILLTSALFGAVHQEPSHIASAFFSGLFLHTLYVCSKSLWPPILLHLLNNAIAFGLLKGEQDGLLPFSVSAELFQTSMMLPSLVATAGLLWLLWRTRRSWRFEDGSVTERGYFSVEPPKEATTSAHQQRGGIFDWLVCGAAVATFLVPLMTFIERQRGPIAAMSVIRQAQAAYEANENAKAALLFSQAIELSPRNAEAWAGRGFTSLFIKDYKRALADADEALEIAPDYSLALATRASALTELLRSAEALPDAKRAAELSPDDTWICSVLVNTAWRAKDYQTAMHAAERGLELDGTMAYFPVALTHLYAICPHTRFRDIPKARLLGEKACFLTSHQDADALISLSTVCWREEKYDEAIELLKQAAALNAGLSSKLAEHFAQDALETCPILAKLRHQWEPRIVDGLLRYQLLHKAYIVVPIDEYSLAKAESVDVPGLNDWKCEVITGSQFDDQCFPFVLQLEQCGISSDQAMMIAYSVALNANDFLTIEDKRLAEALLMTEPAVIELKQKLRRGSTRS